MTAYVALVRAANVGGTGKLPMTTLVAMCQDAGFERVRTFIASGNALFTSRFAEARVRRLLEERLSAFAGKPVDVLVRTAYEMAEVVAANPFVDHPPSRTVAIFLPEPPGAETLATVRGRVDESVALGRREIYVAYGPAMADSKLVVPAASRGTARNMNTVARLAAMASE